MPVSVQHDYTSGHAHDHVAGLGRVTVIDANDAYVPTRLQRRVLFPILRYSSRHVATRRVKGASERAPKTCDEYAPRTIFRTQGRIASDGVGA